MGPTKQDLEKRIAASRKYMISDVTSKRMSVVRGTLTANYEDMFDVLATYAPSVAASPLVATSVVRSMVALTLPPAFTLKMIKEMAETESAIRNSR